MLVDSHCHLLHAAQGNTRLLDELLVNARDAGVVGILSVATTPADLTKMSTLIGARPGIWLGAGLHPESFTRRGGVRVGDEDANESTVAQCLRELPSLLANIAVTDRVVALGESGLDYGATPSITVEADVRRAQYESFQIHLEAGRRANLPVIVHTRGARADTLAALRSVPGSRGVIHCFTEDCDTAYACIDLGFFISFSGILTFRNATDLRDVARRLPLDRILIETDAPWLAPMPHRGKPNQPAWVAKTARCLAELRGVHLEALSESTTRNFESLFGVSVNANDYALAGSNSS